MIEIYKKKYQTSREALDQLRIERPELMHEKLSYNGILDPLAQGVLPVLVGDAENRDRAAFTGSRKVYKVGVLVGISTDSSDLLGVVKKEKGLVNADKKIIVEGFLNHPTKFDQTVPMHSNRKVDGKRLWWWILNGVEIPKEKRPVNSVAIEDISFKGESTITSEDLKKEVEEMRERMDEKFRLSRVVGSWEVFFKENREKEFFVINFEILVTSGFYVRAFVEEIGLQLGVPLMVLSLIRSKIIY